MDPNNVLCLRPYRLANISRLTKLSLESYVTTDGQPASLSLNKAPSWGLRPDLDYCLTVAGLLFWGALSNERSGLSFTIPAGPRQRSHFLVRVPWDSWPYFTVSDSRLPFSVASYDSQGHGGGIRPRLHTGNWLNSKLVPFKISRHRSHRKHRFSLL
jgi:hypothetical protein